MPKAVAALAGKEVVEVAAGTTHTVVRLAKGELRACGNNLRGQLGLGTGERAPEAEPAKVALPPATPPV